MLQGKPEIPKIPPSCTQLPEPAEFLIFFDVALILSRGIQHIFATTCMGGSLKPIYLDVSIFERVVATDWVDIVALWGMINLRVNKGLKSPDVVIL